MSKREFPIDTRINYVEGDRTTTLTRVNRMMWEGYEYDSLPREDRNMVPLRLRHREVMDRIDGNQTVTANYKGFIY